MSKKEPIRFPSQTVINNSNLTQFINYLKQEGIVLDSYSELEQWAIEQNENFWSLFWDFANIVGDRGNKVLEQAPHIIDNKFFDDSKLNYAENLLSFDGKDSAAIIFQAEDKIRRKLTWNELKNSVFKIQQQLIKHGVVQGDRIAGIVSNTPEAVIATLATTSLGAVWTSCSPDFGISAIVERFKQVEPKILFFTESYFYNGKVFSCVEKAYQTMELLTSCELCVLIPIDNKAPPTKLTNSTSRNPFFYWHEWQAIESEESIVFNRVGFNHPLFILYSSGTTGKPKCIVHGVGGTLIEHLKEHQLHCDIKQGDKVFYFTTCSWMMWNWQVSALASGAALVLFDGSPFASYPELMFEYAQKTSVTLFGTSAKYLSVLEKKQIDIRKKFPLESLRTITSTGSPLLENSYEYVYRFIKQDVHLASISGGTDILGCFVLGSPTLPVIKGEIQCKSLGLDVRVLDGTGKKIKEEKGELVCCNAFPSMPICFWNDDKQELYKKAYFERFDNSWTHGDFVCNTANNGYIIYGRSDTILNPGGVRIGTAEIYTCLEIFNRIEDSVVVGIPYKDDIAVILFVIMSENSHLDDGLIDEIKKEIKQSCSPRHVPNQIIAICDIPRTRSGKISEIAVKNILTNTKINNLNSLLNPKSLEYFKEIDLNL